MNNLWLKIKVWTKTTLFAIALLYVLIFVYNNSDQPVHFWYWFHHTQDTSMLVLVGLTFVVGVLCSLIVRTTFTTLRQVRELRARSRIERLERSNAEIKAKAAMLQRVAPSVAATPVTPPAPPLVTDAE